MAKRAAPSSSKDLLSFFAARPIIESDEGDVDDVNENSESDTEIVPSHLFSVLLYLSQRLSVRLSLSRSKNHAKSGSHKDTVTLEAQLCSSVSGGIRHALASVQSARQ